MAKEETGLTITKGLQTPPGALTVEQLQHYGLAFFQSGMFPDIKSAAQAEVKVMAGVELGFSPIYSMTKIYIVKGRVMVGAEALGAMVKRSGRYDYRISKLTDTECELVFTDKGVDTYTSRFTIEDAKRADLMQPGGGWAKWPRAMLMSKAVSQGARAVCPEVISGVYTPEDFGYSTNPETQQVEGIVIEKPEPPKAPTPGQRAAMQKVIDEADKATTKPSNGTESPNLTTQKGKQVSVATASQLRQLEAYKKHFADTHKEDAYNKALTETVPRTANFAEMTGDEVAALIGALSKVK